MRGADGYRWARPSRAEPEPGRSPDHREWLTPTDDPSPPRGQAVSLLAPHPGGEHLWQHWEPGDPHTEQAPRHTGPPPEPADGALLPRVERAREREQRRDQRRAERQQRMLARQAARGGVSPRALEAGSPSTGPGGAVVPARSRPRRERDRAEPAPVASRIALRSIHGHIARSSTGQIMAWYRLAPQAWSFRADSQREQLIDQIAGQIGALKGRWLHLRVTSRPYPVAEWGRGFDENAVGRLPDVSGATSWEQFVTGEQRHLAAQGMSEKEVFVGVEVNRRSAVSRWLGMVEPFLGRLVDKAAGAELAALDSEIDHVDQVMAGAGMDAVPASAAEMAWLMRRSVALGMPPPPDSPVVGDGAWETEDLAAFSDGVAMVGEPYDPALRVIGNVYGQRVERHLVVLTVGAMNPLRIPEAYPPWMVRAEAARCPVEWSARIRVREDEEVTSELRLQMGRVRSQVKHYAEDHNQPPPRSLDAQAQQVQDIEEELASTGLHAHNARVYGWWRIAVSGRDEAEAIRNARAVHAAYKPHVAIEHPEGQHKLAREFIPGEPVASPGYRRRGPARWAAAAVPTVTAAAGDRHGLLLGTAEDAGRRPVAWDPWLAQEARAGQSRSGLTGVVGGLGSGKSFLTGLLVYKSVRAGARWTVLDPSGPLAELTRLPELAPFSRHIHLLGAAPGILNPFRVVAEPRLDQFADAEDPQLAWRKECDDVAAIRRELALSTLVGLLPFEVARETHTQKVLVRAAREVGSGPDRHLGEVIDALRSRDTHHDEALASHAAAVADLLDDRRDQPQAALLFPDPERPVAPWHDSGDIRLTVLSLQGLNLPQVGSSREHWSRAESLAVELLNLASWLTQRSVYAVDRNLRKGVALDEAHFLSQVAGGKYLIDRLARDSRKYNVRALFASQLASDLLKVQGFASLVNSVFVGRTVDEEAQVEALRLLGAPIGVGYEPQLGGLSPGTRADSPREFIFADGWGHTEKITIDLSGPHLARLAEALGTDPDARRVAEHAPGPAAPGPSAPGVDSSTPAGAAAPRPVDRTAETSDEHPAAGSSTEDTDRPGTDRASSREHAVTSSRLADGLVSRARGGEPARDQPGDPSGPGLEGASEITADLSELGGLDELDFDLDEDLEAIPVRSPDAGSAAGTTGEETAGEDPKTRAGLEQRAAPGSDDAPADPPESSEPSGEDPAASGDTSDDELERAIAELLSTGGPR